MCLLDFPFKASSVSEIAFPYSELLGSLSTGNLFCLFVQLSVERIRTVSLNPTPTCPPLFFGVCQLSIQFKLVCFLIVGKKREK